MLAGPRSRKLNVLGPGAAGTAAAIGAPLPRWAARLSIPVALGRVLMLAAVAAGTLLRLYQLGALGLNSDEAVYTGQAAALGEVPVLEEIFPVFRAHPLLFQYALSMLFRTAGGLGVAEYDLLARLASVAVGSLTIWVLYRLGSALYGPVVGGLAAMVLALMPYHTVVTRQVLLDGPMTLCSTLVLLGLARYADTGRRAWLTAAGAALGLTFLAKETGLIFAGSVFLFFALARQIPFRIKDFVPASLAFGTVIAMFPLSLALAGGGGAQKSEQYLVWQLLRRPNHDWRFYLETVPFEIGLLVVLAAALGVVVLRREHGWREQLLMAWIVVPVVFFQFWPVKGFQYLIPAAPAVALLAARALWRWPAVCRSASSGRARLVGAVRLAAIGVVFASSLHASWSRLEDPTFSRFPGGSGGRYLAGSGGVPGGREVGLWVRDHVPTGATVMTIGPSMANIVQFYGHRRALGLSVSSNPLRRNPSYAPIENPDRELRRGSIQYLIWDPYSAARSSHFSDRLLEYGRRYNGRVVYAAGVGPSRAASEPGAAGSIQVIEVRP